MVGIGVIVLVGEAVWVGVFGGSGDTVLVTDERLVAVGRIAVADETCVTVGWRSANIGVDNWLFTPTLQLTVRNTNKTKKAMERRFFGRISIMPLRRSMTPVS